MASDTLTPRQIEALRAAYEAKLHGDGWLVRGMCRIWGVAPTAIMALVRKDFLTMHRSRTQARLTARGLDWIEAHLGVRQRLRAGDEPAWPRDPGADSLREAGASAPAVSPLGRGPRVPRTEAECVPAGAQRLAGQAEPDGCPAKEKK